MDHGSNVVGYFMIVAIFIGTGLLGLFFLIGISKGFGKHSKALSVITGVILFPLLLLSLKLAYAVNDHSDKDRRCFEDTLHEALSSYYLNYPSRFVQVGTDEEVIITDFEPWLKEYLAKNKKNYPEVISAFNFRNGILVDTDGDPMCYVMDIDRDKWISVTGLDFNICDHSGSSRSPAPDSDNYITTICWLGKNNELIKEQPIYKK
jgi:hypothetical protein